MIMFLNMDSFAFYFQVNDILQRCLDLMDRFSEFLEHCENIGRPHILVICVVQFVECTFSILDFIMLGSFFSFLNTSSIHK
jgi:hypothetical protein